jgi:hypothetical protein
MGNGGESFDAMIARVQARRESSMAKGNLAPPFTKKGSSAGSGDETGEKPSFAKKKKGKPFGKSAPAQKSMRAGRSFGRR